MSATSGNKSREKRSLPARRHLKRSSHQSLRHATQILICRFSRRGSAISLCFPIWDWKAGSPSFGICKDYQRHLHCYTLAGASCIQRHIRTSVASLYRFFKPATEASRPLKHTTSNQDRGTLRTWNFRQGVKHNILLESKASFTTTKKQQGLKYFGCNAGNDWIILQSLTTSVFLELDTCNVVPWKYGLFITQRNCTRKCWITICPDTA